MIRSASRGDTRCRRSGPFIGEEGHDAGSRMDLDRDECLLEVGQERLM